jgi:hypothetical protein
LVELVELVSELVFLVEVELELVPDFFSPVIVFLPVVELVVVEVVDDGVSFFLAQETKKARATRTVMKEKMVLFTRIVRAVSLFRGSKNRKHIHLQSLVSPNHGSSVIPSPRRRRGISPIQAKSPKRNSCNPGARERSLASSG